MATRHISDSSILHVLFAPHIEYQPPKSTLGAFLWRRRMWFDSTFGLIAMEPWERWLVLSIFYIIFALVATAMYRYLPANVACLHKRTTYYFFAQDGVGGAAMSRVHLHDLFAVWNRTSKR